MKKSTVINFWIWYELNNVEHKQRSIRTKSGFLLGTEGGQEEKVECRKQKTSETEKKQKQKGNNMK